MSSTAHAASSLILITSHCVNAAHSRVTPHTCRDSVALVELLFGYMHCIRNLIAILILYHMPHLISRQDASCDVQHRTSANRSNEWKEFCVAGSATAHKDDCFDSSSSAIVLASSRTNQRSLTWTTTLIRKEQ
ncbi:hypothetical protein DFH29DRAFT_950412 [Suillus ampliporus]|nr:hypothetical protein DFH29DRAFT_950412 [Suillus ampliporus]